MAVLKFGFELDDRIIPKVTVALLLVCVPLVYHFTIVEHRPPKLPTITVASVSAPVRIVVTPDEYANEQQRMNHKLHRAVFLPVNLIPLPLGPR